MTGVDLDRAVGWARRLSHGERASRARVSRIEVDDRDRSLAMKNAIVWREVAPAHSP
jgi:hypothetical protein